MPTKDLIHAWYVNRFMRLRQTAFRDPDSFFKRYAQVSEEEALRSPKGSGRTST
jgi:type I pantothenate kinase